MNFYDLYDYQKDGVQWLLTPFREMNYKPHKLLADEPGLGKTAQAIVAANIIKPKKILIVCLATIKETWKHEIIRWEGALESEVFIVWTGKDNIPRSAKYVITSYELLHKNHILKQLLSIWFDIGIVDEAHKIKSGRAKITRRMLRQVGKRPALMSRCYHKWFLTGSFLENRMKETYTLLRTMCPELLGKYIEFKDFGDRYCDGPGSDKSYSGSTNVAELRDNIAGIFMLRREFKDVHDIPPLIEKNIYCKVDMPTMTNWEGEEVEVDESNTHLMTLWEKVGEQKIPFSLQYIKEKLETTNKLVVFAYHKKVIAGLYEGISAAGYKPLKIHGGVSPKQKEVIKNQFINDPDANPLIIQTDSAGTGVDGIQKVCHNGVFVEKVWSGGKDLQAIGRLLRLHQTKPVYMDTIIGGDTVCEGINWSVKNKKNIIWEFNNVNKTPTREKQMIEDVLERIATALEALVKQGGKSPSPAVDSHSGTKSTQEPVDASTASVEKPKAKGKSTQASAKDSTLEKPATAKGGKKKKATHDDIVETARAVIESFEVEQEGKDRVNEIILDVVGKKSKLREVPAEHIEAVVEALKIELEEVASEAEEAEDDDFE